MNGLRKLALTAAMVTALGAVELTAGAESADAMLTCPVLSVACNEWSYSEMVSACEGLCSGATGAMCVEVHNQYYLHCLKDPD